MKITPLDNLLYTAVKMQQHFMLFKQFGELLKSVQPIAVDWSEWQYNWEAPTLSATSPKLWDIGPALCIFTDRGILSGRYNPTIEVDPRQTKLFLAQWPCELQSILLFRKSETSFDAIPMMNVIGSKEAMFPEFQLRFDWDAETKTWAAQVSPSGFVNAYVYWPLLADMTDAEKKMIEDRLELVSNVIIRYLGAYEQWLEQPGKLESFQPRAAKVKTDAKGNIKKIYQLAQCGYRHYVPERKA